MSRHRKAQSLSLFPFLAVLICTMGVLVALLLLVVKQAEQSGLREQTEDVAAARMQLDDLELQLAELSLRNRLLEDRRQRDQLELARQRNELGHLDNEMQRVKAEAEKILAELAAGRAAESESTDRLRLTESLVRQQSELAELRQALTAAQTELQQVGQPSGRQAAPVYSIVPIAAQSGTNRRPIYIECRADGLRLHPGNIPLTLDDFVLPLIPGNPLDAALLAYREYWRQALGSQSAQANAYPLMVVRPSGAKWYSVARRAMSGWDQEFGYELIPEDWEVNFGTVDPALVQHVQLAIRSAMVRQAAMVAYGQATPASQAYSVQPTSAVGASERALVPAVGGGFAAAPTRGGAGGGDSPRRGSTSRGEGLPAARSSERVDPIALFSSDFHQTRPNDSMTLGGRDRAAESAPSSSLFSSSRQTPTAPNLAAGSDRKRGTDEQSAGASAAAASRPPLGAAGDNRNHMKEADPSRMVRRTEPTSGDSSRSAHNATAGSSPNSGSPLTAGGGGAPMMGSMSAASNPDSAGSGEPTSALAANLNPQSLAHQRGTDWALPSRRNAVSAYHRPIVVRVTPTALVLPAGEGSPQEQTVPFSQSLTDAMDPLANVIWQRVDKWGYLGFGGYWKPVLELQYDPSAATLARNLEQLLEGSGLDVKHPEPPSATSASRDIPTPGVRR